MASQGMDLINLDKSNWQTYRFDQIAKNISERVDPNNTDLQVYIGLEHIDAESIHIKRSGTPDDVDGQKLRCYPGDVIFGRRRAYQRKAAIATVDGFCSAHSLVLRANPDVIESRLFPFFMHSDAFMHRAVDISVGSLSPTINWGTLKHQEFQLPPKHQQAQLAELLWCADSVLENNLFLLKYSDIYVGSLIENNLTSNRNTGVLSDYCSNDGVRIGPFGSLLHASDYQTEGVPLVMPANIVNGVINEEGIARISKKKAEELANYQLKENDILFPRRGDLTKRAIVLKHQENWICGTGTIRVRLVEGINPNAVFYAVTSSSINNWLSGASVGTTMQNLNASTIKNIPFHLPKGPEAQKTLRNIESALNTSVCIKNNIRSIENLKKALINEIF